MSESIGSRPPCEKRPREALDDRGDACVDDGDDSLLEDDAGASLGVSPRSGVIMDIPVEDQVKFSGLLGADKRPRPTPLSRYRLLGRSGLRVSPRLFSSTLVHTQLSHKYRTLTCPRDCLDCCVVVVLQHQCAWARCALDRTGLR